MGIPTVTITTTELYSLARSTQRSQGLRDMSFVVIPHPIGMISREEVIAKVDAAYDDIINAALNWKPDPANDPGLKVEAPYPARRIKVKGTYSDVNDLFFRRKWSLSLPIIPPTEDKVAAMLKGTTRDPSEVVWVVPPREGQLTVELVATLGVMAGCRPEHMPLLLAAVEAMADPVAATRGPTATTAPAVPLFFISGPIIDQLKLNPGTGTGGAEQPVTNAMGYFVNLVLDVVGGSWAQTVDKSSHGTSADLVAQVFTENAAQNPWKESYAEEVGFKPADSVVTFFWAYPGNASLDHISHDGDTLLNTLCAGLLGTVSGNISCFADYDKPYSPTNKETFSFFVLGPEHAATIHKDFPNKDDVRRYVQEHAVMPVRFYGPRGSVCDPSPHMPNWDEDTLVPRFLKPESVKFLVSGGAGKQSQIWVPFPQTFRPVSKLIGN